MTGNSKKIILDLCGGTGSWSKPYKDAGYTVFNITLPYFDVTETTIWKTRNGGDLSFYNESRVEVLRLKLKDIYGILAAPPCTMFSFARTNAKTPRDLMEGMQCVRSCLEIIWACNEIQQETGKKKLPLKFWALENPYHGFLSQFLGKPAFMFDPWEFGDRYQKRTALWGYFKEPIKKDFPLIEHKRGRVKFDYMASKDIHPEYVGTFDRKTRRSITPQGFAKAFYEANK